jgi:hypothetical protein
MSDSIETGHHQGAHDEHRSEADRHEEIQRHGDRKYRAGTINKTSTAAVLDVDAALINRVVA